MVIWSYSSIIFRADNLSHLWDLINSSEFPNLLTSLSPMEALSTLKGLPAVCTIRAKGPQQCFDVVGGARSSRAGAGSCCATLLSGITNIVAQRSLCLMRCSPADTWNRGTRNDSSHVSLPRCVSHFAIRKRRLQNRLISRAHLIKC